MTGQSPARTCKHKIARNALLVITAIFLIYFFSYVVLSVSGQYQPIAVGIDHVELYAWAPFGFYDPDHAWRGSVYAIRHPTEKTGGWKYFPGRMYEPLWKFDCRFIHPYK